MPESNDARRRQLQNALRKRGKRLPPEMARLGDAIWNDTDEPSAHSECEAALPTYIRDEVAGAAVAQLYPDVKHHLDRCERCSALHADLTEIAFAQAKGQLPKPARPSRPDLSFLPPLSDQVPLGRWAKQLWQSLGPQWLGQVLSRDVVRLPAGAMGVRPELERGQTEDGALNWQVSEDDDENLTIHIHSDLPLEGGELELKAGDWSGTVVLRRISPEEVGANVVLTRADRPGEWMEEGVPLTIARVVAPAEQ